MTVDSTLQYFGTETGSRFVQQIRPVRGIFAFRFSHSWIKYCGKTLSTLEIVSLPFLGERRKTAARIVRPVSVRSNLDIV